MDITLKHNHTEYHSPPATGVGPGVGTKSETIRTIQGLLGERPKLFQVNAVKSHHVESSESRAKGERNIESYGIISDT